MPNYIRKTFDEMDILRSGAVKLARKSLGVSAFGLQIFEFPPGAATPLHDEASTGQEEVYIGLSGSGWVEVDGERVELGPRSAVFVPPGVMRTTVAGPDGLSFIAVGAAPQPHHPPNRKFD